MFVQRLWETEMTSIKSVCRYLDSRFCRLVEIAISRWNSLEKRVQLVKLNMLRGRSDPPRHAPVQTPRELDNV